MQWTQGARLAAHRETHWNIRRRRPHGPFLTCRTPPSPHGTVLAVPPWLLYRQLGERPAAQTCDSTRLIVVSWAAAQSKLATLLGGPLRARDRAKVCSL